MREGDQKRQTDRQTEGKCLALLFSVRVGWGSIFGWSSEFRCSSNIVKTIEELFQEVANFDLESQKYGDARRWAEPRSPIEKKKKYRQTNQSAFGGFTSCPCLYYIKYLSIYLNACLPITLILDNWLGLVTIRIIKYWIPWRDRFKQFPKSIKRKIVPRWFNLISVEREIIHDYPTLLRNFRVRNYFFWVENSWQLLTKKNV